MHMRTVLLSLLVVVGLALGGCTTPSNSGAGSDDGLGSGAIGSPKEVQATDTTGGIRGVVVDQAVRPIKGATVTVSGNGVAKDLTTDAGGTFSVSGLPAGTYLVKSSHPLYDSAQQSVEVKAGIKNPPVVKVQLNQKVFAKPYLVTKKYKGFIVCSIGAAFVASEECGEGVGSPRTTCSEGAPPPCVDNPVSPGQRVAHQGDNNVQFDFYVDGSFVRTILIEQVWTANSQATGQFYTVAPAVNWTCDPGCGGNQLGDMTGPSPLTSRIQVENGTAIANPSAIQAAETTYENQTITSATKLTTFTWPAWGDCGGISSAKDNPVCLAQFNNAAGQEFQLFVSAFYYLPAPADWSFLKGSADPFA
jgi:hypothetical protein